MYIPRIHKNDNFEEIKSFVEDNGFGIIISQDVGIISATHIPMQLKVFNDEWYLHGHLAKGNPQWKQFSEHQEVLVIFQGPHSYISSSWYDHINVPTWNYIAVHLSGKIRIQTPNELEDTVVDLVEKYEQKSKQPFSIESMKREDFKKQLAGIVGFEIKITKIEGKKKLSQNRNSTDFNNIIKKLDESKNWEAQQVANEMRKLKNNP